METDFVYIHIISFPIFLYYRQYIIALWTATIFTTSYFCWKKNELVNVDKMVARFGIIALNLYTMHPLYTLGTIISVCGYMYGNYVLRTTGKIYPIWWSLNHIIGTALNIYFIHQSTCDKTHRCTRRPGSPGWPTFPRRTVPSAPCCSRLGYHAWGGPGSFAC